MTLATETGDMCLPAGRDPETILAKALRLARIVPKVTRPLDATGFGTRKALVRAELSTLPTAMVREALLLAAECGMNATDLGMSSDEAERIISTTGLVVYVGIDAHSHAELERAAFNWVLPQDDGQPVDFDTRTDTDRLARIVAFLAGRPDWTLLTMDDGRKFGIHRFNQWRFTRQRLIAAGLTAEHRHNGRVLVAVTPKGHRWLAEQGRAAG